MQSARADVGIGPYMVLRRFAPAHQVEQSHVPTETVRILGCTSRHVQLVEVFVAVFGDVFFSSLQIIAQQQIKDLHRAFHILWHDLDEPARSGVHGRHPHHLGIVFAKALGSVDGKLLALQLLDLVLRRL